MPFVRIAAAGHAGLYEWVPAIPTAPVAWCGYLLTTGASAITSLTAQQAWEDHWGAPINDVNGGCYAVDVAAPADPAALLGRLLDRVRELNEAPVTGGYAYRYLMWVPPADGQWQQVNFADDGRGNGKVVFDATLSWRNVQLVAPNGVTVTADTAETAPSLALQPFAGGATASFWNVVDTPVRFGSVPSAVTLALDGPAAGRLDTALDLVVSAVPTGNDLRLMRTGVEYVFERAAGGQEAGRPARVIGRLYPDLDTAPAGTARLAVRLDPLRPLDATRTAFVFADGPDGPPPAFASFLVTDAGHAVRLTPAAGEAGYVLQDERKPVRFLDPTDPQVPTYYFTPSGPFAVAYDGAGPASLLCGVSGVETVTCSNGDVLTFHPDQPAYAVRYPLPGVDLDKPGTPPVTAVLMDRTFTTAWATLSPGEAAGGAATAARNVYWSQPHGASLFSGSGAGATAATAAGAEPPALGYHPTPLAALGGAAAAASFPLTAFAGMAWGEVDDPADAARFEAEIVSPTRKQAILAARPSVPAALAAVAGDSVPMTTPQGLLVTPDADPMAPWRTVLLGRNTDSTGAYELAFSNVDSALHDALLTNQQFLVVTRPRLPWNGSGTVFDNLMSIEGWPFRVAVPAQVTPGSYDNVLVFKFVRGKLSDQVANPSNWTGAADFNDPANQGLALVSQWLQDYIADARRMAAFEQAHGGDSYFQHFLDIVDSETWNGILALKVDVDVAGFPPELKGLIAGIDLSRLNAHHLGIEVSFVQAGPDGPYVAGNSSMFGLVYYVDPAYETQLALGGDPDRPVPAAPGAFDFKVLTLKTLFENTAVKAFDSRLQLTVNEWFGDAVVAVADGTGARLDLPSYSIVLDGAFERHDGDATFTFTSSADRLFRLGSNVLGGVETVRASYATLAQRADGIVRSRFTLAGYLNFLPVAGLDVFSFGSDWAAGQAGGRQGLAFSNLYVDLAFPLATPSLLTYAFVTDEIAFDAVQSRARPGSLFPRFPLKVASLVVGTADATPRQLGYLGVTLPSGARFGGVRGAWHGLLFQLDLGTAGALAGDVGLAAYLLAAWSPGSGGSGPGCDATVGLRLPGTSGAGKVLSLQGVLALSVGDVELVLGETAAGDPAYLLKLGKIALKLLGLSFPTSGNTTFYVFGDPAPGAPQDAAGWYAAYVKDAKAAMR
jgi:hypothetical protein